MIIKNIVTDLKLRATYELRVNVIQFIISIVKL